jgi:SAM-dependent methyltransferase
MIVTWSKGPADDAMPEEALVENLQLVRGHFWWQTRAELALATLRRYGIAPPASVLEVGCGWGVNLDALEAAGYAASGLDISRPILERIDRPARHLIEADLSCPLPPDVGRFDSLLALDVLEHVDDDSGMVHRLAQLVRPGGIAVISVPARPDLFSEFDAIQKHRRRYEPDGLRALFTGSGLEVRTIFWWGAWMVPVMRWSRRSHLKAAIGSPRTYASYLRLPPWPIPLLMKLLCRWESSRALKGRLRTGSSLFTVAVQPLAGP